MSTRALWILIAAFCVSVLVRLPQLDRPLSAHHEYCTAFTLIALNNWYANGFAHHHGMPSGGFISEGERFLPPDMSRNDRALALYYFSHPPLAYDLPYALFSLLGKAPNVLGLQLFNLFFHLVCAIALFHVVREVVGPTPTEAPLFAAVLYLFMPAPLWFHSNVYMSDMFVQNFWVMHLIFAMRLFKQRTRIPTSLMAAFGVTLFLTVYTSWLGVFAAATAIVLAFWGWRKNRSPRFASVVAVSIIAVLLALGLTAWRYLQVIDAEALFAHFGQRFDARGSFALPHGIGPHLRQLLVNYRIGYLPVVVLLLLVYALRRWRWAASIDAPNMPLFLALAGLPVLLDHSVLLQYADHDFAALKAGPILCGLAGVGLASLPRRLSVGAMATTCVAGVLYFYRTNPCSPADAVRYRQEMELGHFIAAQAYTDEMIFAIGVSTEPQVAWYAKRNVIGVRGVGDVARYMNEAEIDRAVIIVVRNGSWTVDHRVR